MSEIAIAVTGLSLLLYAFKLCEYFESEVDKALDRKIELETWKKEGVELTCIDKAIGSQEAIIKAYSHRTRYVIFPNCMLFISFCLAWFQYALSRFNPICGATISWSFILVSNLFTLSFLTPISLSFYVWICSVSTCILIIGYFVYLVGVFIPLYGAAKGMWQRPTNKYLEIKKKYIDQGGNPKRYTPDPKMKK